MNYEQKKQIFEKELKKHEQDCRDLTAWLGDHPEISCHEKESCARVCALLEKEGFLFKKVVATEHIELTNRYGVKQAPTLVVLGAGDEYTKFKGVSEIKGMLTARQAV